MSFLDNDIATVWRDRSLPRSGDNLLAALYWGDELQVIDRVGDDTHVDIGSGRQGWVRNLRLRSSGLLECAVVDVGQGDACLVTTPERKRILVDGGENKLAARYLASRFWAETQSGSLVMLDAIVVTHGDADHFDGLSYLVLDAVDDARARKGIRIAARRLFHNGLVKRVSSLPDAQHLGSPINHDGKLYAPVVDDPRTVIDANMPFKRWQAAITELAKRHPIEVRRIDDSCADAFSFLSDVGVAIIGPTTQALPDGGVGLPFLAAGAGAPSAAQTINGHSIALMISMGNVRLFLTGDLTRVAGDALAMHHRAGRISLRADVFKVPHHGSDDVSRDFIEAVQPLISIISAGDEDARRDYLHPRANLVGLLGRANRGAEPVIFVTNLAAFDRWAGPAFRAVERKGRMVPDLDEGTFYARERTSFGIVHVRTDGERILVVRRGARSDRFEPYVFYVGVQGTARKGKVDRV